MTQPPIISKKDFDAVIFDLDGVVTKTAKVHAKAWKEMFDQFLESREEPQEPFDIESDYNRYVDGKPRYKGVKSFLDSRGIDIAYGRSDDVPELETVCGLGNRKNRIFLKIIDRDGVDIFDNTVEFIDRILNKGFRTGIVSSSKNCGAVLKAANLAHLFQVKVDANDAKSLDLAGKPEGDTYLEAANRLEVEPGRAVVVEDAISGIQAGKNGGFGMVIGMPRAGQEKELREAGADLVLKELSKIDLKIRIDDLPDALDSFPLIEEGRSKGRTVIFLDYDGTLTPIVSRPEDAVLDQGNREVLTELAELCTVAVVSGRGLRDVKALVDIPNLHYAGSHGYEIEGPEGLKMEHSQAMEFLPVLDKVEKELGKALENIEGSQVERKKFSIAVHYRNVDPAKAGDVEKVVDAKLEENPTLRKGTGKKVFELQPNLDWNKGKALGWLLNALGYEPTEVQPFYIGDDITDEDAFRAIEYHGQGVVVGSGGRETTARFRLDDTEHVMKFLRRLTTIIKEGTEWSFVYEGFEPGEEGLRETLCTLGNGYFCTRGAYPHSEADDVHYPGTYLAGGYNRLETEVKDRIIENEDLFNLPNWLCLDFRCPGEDWFDLEDVEVLSSRQTLDMKTGVLNRTLRFRDKKERITRFSERRLVHMRHMHLAAMEIVITPENWYGELEIRSALDGSVVNAGVERYKGLSNRHLVPLEAEQLDKKTIYLKMRTARSRIELAYGARTDVFEGIKPVNTERELIKDDDYIAQQFTLNVESGSSIKLEKIVTLYTSRDPAISSCCHEAKKNALEIYRFADMLNSHTKAWEHLWNRFDVRLNHIGEGENDIQRILRLYTFHLIQTASIHSLDIDVGMPARGWHGEAYRGHIFWDEVFIFPLLNYRMPQITRSLLMYRYRRLNEAYRAAREMGYKGAMFPWQSGSDGREESQRIHLNPESGRWIPDNSRLQRHISSAIAYNIWQYYQTTGDLEFLSSYGGEMIIAIARFWASIATFNKQEDKYEILGVMGPDEYHDAYPDSDRPGLDNNAYTNVMAVFVFNKALDLGTHIPRGVWEELKNKMEITPRELNRWREIARKMKVPFHDNGIISQFEGYEKLKEFDWERYRKKYDDIQRLDRILEAEGDHPNRYKLSKQADALMLFYLFSAEELEGMFRQLGYDFDPESIPRNIDYYIKRTSHGSSLSRVIHSWVLYRSDRAGSWKLYTEALKTDVADIQGGTTKEGIHLGAMAGCVDIVQRGLFGLETRKDHLRLNPELPEELDRLSLHLRYRGRWLELVLTPDHLTIEALPGGAGPIKIVLDGTEFELHEGEKREIDL